jgi:hypothetical protein
MEQLLAHQTSCWVERLRLLGQDHPDTLAALSAVAATMRGLHMAPEGQLSGLEETVLAGKRMLASTLRDLGQLTEAKGLLEEVLEIVLKVLGPDHFDTLDAKTEVAAALHSLGPAGRSEGPQDRGVGCTAAAAWA